VHRARSLKGKPVVGPGTPVYNLRWIRAGEQGEGGGTVAEESMAERLVRLLIERELTLGTVECGVGGVVSRRVFGTDEGVNVLGNSLILDDADEAVGAMELPRPQFRKAGVVSAKAARAAAREGRGFLGVQVCLVVWAGGRVTQEEQQTVFVAVDTGRDAVDEAFEVGGETGHDEVWLSNRALEVVLETLA
jgi:nicotinamide mononucleotide (NMN) deamidase PncC